MATSKCARPRFLRLSVDLVLFTLFTGLVVLPAMAGQGAANPAGITGVVTDNTGAVLPGVTVTVTSPALQVPSVTTVSDVRGEYRLSPLPIGTYTVLFELVGFQNIRREGVRLTVGFTARVDTELGVGAVAETITVSGASPLVDTTSTATATELTHEQLEVLPTSRDGFHAFLNQVPGVRTNLDVGSSGLGDTVQFRAYGQVGAPWQMLEGVLASAPDAGGMIGSHVDFNAIDGTRVQTVGSNAEMPRRGLLVDSVIKSGGNDFHGTAVVYGSGPKLEANNIDATLKAAGIRPIKLDRIYDYSGTIGGRIIQNKLWFFAGARDEKVTREILDAFDPQGDPNGTPILSVARDPYFFEKVSYQASTANRLTSFYHFTNDLALRDASRFVPRESMNDKNNPVWMTKGEWQTVRGNAFVASMQFGIWDYAKTRSIGLAPGKVSTIDIATQFVTGDNWNSNGVLEDAGRRHTKGVLSYYKADWLGGNHEFKVGVDHLWSWRDYGWTTTNLQGYQLQFNNGVPFQIVTRNAPVKGQNHGNYFGVYGQDSWTLARRLTLNLGLRVEHDTAYAPEQCREAGKFATAQCWDEIRLVTFNSIAPRAHLAFDVMSDGKTVIKGGYGRFNQLRELSPDLTNINQNTAATITWTWRDLNGNRDYDPDEVNLDPNGPDFRSIAGTALGVVNPNEKQPKTDEFSLTFERELVADTAMRVTGVYSRTSSTYGLAQISRDGQYTIPVTNPDPGPDGRLGTADDTGQLITYYEYPTSLSGAAFANTMIVDNSAADSSYRTFEIAITKRPSNNWQASTSYTGTWVNIPITCGGSGSGIGTTVSRCLTDPNTTFNSANETLEAGFRASGAYNFPFEILASANYDIRSGRPQARQVLFTGGRSIRSITLNVDPLGTIALPRTHVLDVRLAKRVGLGGSRSIELRGDIYNVLNKGTVTNRNLLSGADYLRPLAAGQANPGILFPRILQAGVTFTY